ncbi:hypothetical protein BJ508DRAFT_366968 [Ascobolus immersus RN42]|uniref:dolichol kinase n=1 Tax=Ascobolus immersus RN42 TaxID=1160509 RepID=A0A3N4HLF8_ASCIM|nr:hypothetical protein BJ508DRAFT_366968 [Ascobolus immersus RN42]
MTEPTPPTPGPSSQPLLDLPPHPDLPPTPGPSQCPSPPPPLSRTPRPYAAPPPSHLLTPPYPPTPSSDQATEADDEASLPRKLPAPPRPSKSTSWNTNRTRMLIELVLLTTLVTGVFLGSGLRVEQHEWGPLARWAGVVCSGWLFGARQRGWGRRGGGDVAEWVYPALIPVLMAVQIGSGVVPGNLVLSVGAFPLRWRQTELVGLLVDYERWNDEGCWIWAIQGYLMVALEGLVGGSLSRTEIRILSVGLVDLLWYGGAPHMRLLQAALWGTGLGIWWVLESPLRWGVQIARIPRHRFRVEGTLRRRQGKNAVPVSGNYSESEGEETPAPRGNAKGKARAGVVEFVAGKGKGAVPVSIAMPAAAPVVLEGLPKVDVETPLLAQPGPSSLPTLNAPAPMKRRKRTNSLRSAPTMAYWRSLTYTQARRRKWVYALLSYSVVAVLTLATLPYITTYAFAGHPPPLWLGSYLFCSQPVWGRVLKAVPLLPAGWRELYSSCEAWEEHPYFSSGTDTLRLHIMLYWLLILALSIPLSLVLHPYIRLDTRRKIFHLTVVIILLPTLPLQPQFIALVLSVLLPLFLFTDLLRATQLPPFGAAIGRFLEPFVDGRDLKGPVVVSHVFLLLGCSITVWLTLASGIVTAKRLVAGTVSVGIGDAAASVTGKRFGHLGPVWGWGGKTIIGSCGFVIGVCTGFVLVDILTGNVRLWGEEWVLEWGKVLLVGVAGGVWEAVVRGGNDNLVVPGVVWLAGGAVGW